MLSRFKKHFSLEELFRVRVIVYVSLGIFFLFFLITFIVKKEREQSVFNAEVGSIISEVETIKTENIKNGYFYKNSSNNIIAIDILFKGGASLDTEGYEGISNFLANTMVLGAGGLKPIDFERKLEENSIILTGTAGRDSINIRIIALNHYEDVMFDVLDKLLNAPNLGIEEISLAKDGILANLNIVSNSPAYLLNKEMRKQLFANNKYYRDIEGSRESINKIDGNILMNFKKQVITKENAYISVSGNVDSTKLSSKLDAILQKLPNGSEDANKFDEAIPTINNQVIEVPYQDAKQSNIYIIFKTPNFQDNNYIYAKLFNTYLGRIPDSLLFNEIRNKNGLVYGINSSLYYDSFSSFGIVSLGTSVDKADVAIEKVKNILSNIKSDYKFADIVIARNWFQNSELAKFVTNESIASFLNNMQFYEVSYNDYLAEKVDLRDVNKANIDDVLKDFNFNNLLIIKTVPKK